MPCAGYGLECVRPLFPKLASAATDPIALVQQRSRSLIRILQRQSCLLRSQPRTCPACSLVANANVLRVARCLMPGTPVTFQLRNFHLEAHTSCLRLDHGTRRHLSTAQKTHQECKAPFVALNQGSSLSSERNACFGKSAADDSPPICITN